MKILRNLVIIVSIISALTGCGGDQCGGFWCEGKFEISVGETISGLTLEGRENDWEDLSVHEFEFTPTSIGNYRLTINTNESGKAGTIIQPSQIMGQNIPGTWYIPVNQSWLDKSLYFYFYVPDYMAVNYSITLSY